MKYNGFGKIKQNYYFFPLEYLKILIKTNIKMPWFTSSKAILFSERQAKGENFLLSNKILYPYTYLPETFEELNTPLNLSISVTNRIKESKIANQNQKSKIDEDFEEIYNELFKIFKFNSKENLDLPVTVSARFLYSCIHAKKQGLQFDLEVINKALDLYISKIKFSDSESLSFVLSALNTFNINNSNYWDPCLKRLKEVRFPHEFTKVTNTSPNLFSYKENGNEEVILDNNPFDEASNVYKNLHDAEKKGISGVSNALSLFEKRIDLTVHNPLI